MFSASASDARDGQGRGDHGQRPVPGQCLGDELRGEALVDEDRLGVAEQFGRGGRDPALLGYVAGGAERERRLEAGALHGVGAAVGAADQAVVLQGAQIAP